MTRRREKPLATFHWNKRGRIFNPLDFPQPPWLAEFAQAPCALIFDDFIRVYFSTRPPPDGRRQYVSHCGFVDLDRRDFRRVLRVSEQPILSLGDCGEFDEFGTYPASVIRTPEDIRVYYGGWTRCESVPFNVAVGLGISHDNGETFKKYGRGPILSYSPDEPFVISGPKIRRFKDTWVLWYIAGKKWIKAEGRPEPVYKIRMAVSANGLQWTKLHRDLIESRLEEDEAQASPDVIFSRGRFHMFFCYRYSAGYRGKARGYRIGYASSADMYAWSRDDSRAGLDPSAEGWDAEMVAYPHIFECDGTMHMLYLGNQVGRYGFGWAVLEGDLS